ncbi:uncharacterized protein LOC141903485 [Tubulanus polymorphus]|uniref:uncharacterized protein LOC141903485 n=1 Tax=Tubulanus polymorphus TaxID=672921 RepID=UPI003DA2C601
MAVITMENEGNSSLVCFVVVSVFSVLGLVFCLLFLVFNCRYRHLRLIKMSSPNINLLLLLGGALAYLSCSVYGLNSLNTSVDSAQSSSVICQIWCWMVNIGFSLLYGSMFAKSWRVYRIFRNTTVKRIVIKDGILIGIVFTLVVVDVIVLGAWQGFDPLEFVHEEILKTHFEYDFIMSFQISLNASEPMQDIISMSSCRSQYSSAWLSGIIVYKGALLFYGTYLSWSIRHVTLPAMSESSSIIISSHVTMIAGCACVAVTSKMQQWPDALYVFVAAVVWISTTVTLFLVFTPKILAWKNSSADQFSKVTLTSQVFGSPNSSYEQIEEEMYHLVAENRALKKSLTSKDVTIQSLQTHVVSARQKLVRLMVDQEFVDTPIYDSGYGDTGAEYQLPSSDLQSSPNTIDSGVSTQGSPPLNDVPEPQCTCPHSHGHELDESMATNRSLKNSKLKRRASLRSVKSIKSCASERIVYGLVKDLDNLNDISTHLRTAIVKEIDTCRPKSAVYDDICAKQNLAGTIADSYALDDNCATYNFIRTYMRREGHVSCDASVVSPPTGQSIKNGMDVSRAPRTLESCGYVSGPGSAMSRCSSCDSINYLSNDRFYPTPTSRRSRYGARASGRSTLSTRSGRRRSRRNRGLKTATTATDIRTVHPKDVIVQMPRDPLQNITNVAKRREIASTISIV